MKTTNTQKKIVIYTWHDISKAYSCLHYLKDELEKYGKVELWSLTPLKYKDILDKEGYYSFFNQKYWTVPLLRNMFSKIAMIIKAVRNPYDIYIINDLDFYLPALISKIINPRIIIIHYNTEILGKDINSPLYMKIIYSLFSDFPDMIIECLEERAKWRKERYHIKQHIYTINNTLPNYVIDKYNECIISDYTKRAKGKKILLYAGGYSPSRNMFEIFECIPQFKDKIYFLFFLYGGEKDLIELKEWVKKYESLDNFEINDAVSKDYLFPIMKQCDIGLNYYDPKVSINHKYASPSKIYEYMACGMSILSTDNIGINRIINENKVGVCLHEGESISSGLNRLINSDILTKDDIIKVFNLKYEYKLDSHTTIERILEFI